jgi:hypothetical protein
MTLEDEFFKEKIITFFFCRFEGATRKFVWDRKRFRIDHTPDITIRLMRYLTLIVNNVLIGLMRGEMVNSICSNLKRNNEELGSRSLRNF